MMADKLTDALFNNGWVRVGADHEFGTYHWRNDDWPDVSIETGGGWAIHGAAAPPLIAAYQARVRPLGNGGDYDKLADFLDWLGPHPPKATVAK